MQSALPASASCEGTNSPPNGFIDDTSPSSAQNVVELDIPDGGIEAWCTVLGAFLSQICGYGYTAAFGVYQAFYAQQYIQNESASTVSWIGSLATFIVNGLGAVCGPLFDNGYFYHVYIAGAILQSLAIFMLSLVQPGQFYQIILIQGVMSGIGQGLMYIPSFAIVSHHFRRRRTTVMSIVSSGSAFGGIINTIMLNKLLNGPMGFKTGVRISGAFISALLFLSCILIRTRYKAVHDKTPSVNFWKATRKCFTELPSLLTIIAYTLFQIPLLYPFFYFQVDSLRHGLSPSFAFYSLVMVNGGSFVARFTAGPVASFVGVVNLTIISTVACGILIIGMIWLGSVASVVVLGLLYGLFSGWNVAMMAPMFGLTADPTELGVRIGIGFAVTSIGCLIGSPICGALLTARYLWWAPAVFCMVIALTAGVMLIGVRFLLARAKGEGEHGAGKGSECEKSCG